MPGLEGPTQPVLVDAAGGVSLPAIVLDGALRDPAAVLAAMTEPDLYYVPAWGHFAVRVGGVLFHGNIGKIFSPKNQRANSPVRVRECRYGAACRNLRGRCLFYHDPAASGVPEVRNFTAGSWTYMPASFGEAPVAARRVGSGASLAEDLAALSPPDARLFLDQTSHDLLVALAVAGRLRR